MLRDITKRTTRPSTAKNHPAPNFIRAQVETRGQFNIVTFLQEAE